MFFLYAILSLSAQEETSISQEILTLAGNIENGKYLELSDGSYWEVAPDSQSISQLWIFPAPLKIVPGKDPNYPYLLINANTQEEVLAKPIEKIP